jgi:hypothetical protein
MSFEYLIENKQARKGNSGRVASNYASAAPETDDSTALISLPIPVYPGNDRSRFLLVVGIVAAPLRHKEGFEMPEYRNTETPKFRNPKLKLYSLLMQ